MLRFSLAAIFISVGCAPGVMSPVRTASAHDLPILGGPSYTGVIFPKESLEGRSTVLGVRATAFWTPGPDVIATIESGVRSILERGLTDPKSLDPSSEHSPQRSSYLTREVGKILEGLATYRRQYIGIVATDGTRRVLVNCFPGPSVDSSDLFPYWRQQPVLVLDGGYRYWRIQYDVDTGLFMEFGSNGYA